MWKTLQTGFPHSAHACWMLATHSSTWISPATIAGNGQDGSRCVFRKGVATLTRPAP